MLRFASSSTGTLHAGELRIALINYIVARQREEGFFLRIDDGGSDEKIRVQAMEIPPILEKFAIQADQTLYESETLRRYQQLAVRLVEEKKAFVCLCDEEHSCTRRCDTMSREEILQIREKNLPYTLRMRKPSEKIAYRDLLRGETVATPAEVDHFVILKADGTPGRDFALACDDMMSGTTLVIGEESRIPHAARQIHVRQTLGYSETIDYAHLPPLQKEQGGVLSHREEEYSVKKLLLDGFLPDAIINYLLLLGYEAPTELFTLPEAIEWFDLNKLSTEPVRFHLSKLRRLNREHLLRMDDRALSRTFRFADPDIGKIAKLYLHTGAATLKELQEHISTLFSPKSCEGPHAEAMRTLSALILEAPMMERYEEFVRYLEERSGLHGDGLYIPLRLLMTGSFEGPDPSEIYPLLNPYLTEIVRCQH